MIILNLPKYFTYSPTRQLRVRLLLEISYVNTTLATFISRFKINGYHLNIQLQNRWVDLRLVERYKLFRNYVIQNQFKFSPQLM